MRPSRSASALPSALPKETQTSSRTTNGTQVRIFQPRAASTSMSSRKTMPTVR